MPKIKQFTRNVSANTGFIQAKADASDFFAGSLGEGLTELGGYLKEKQLKQDKTQYLSDLSQLKMDNLNARQDLSTQEFDHDADFGQEYVANLEQRAASMNVPDSMKEQFQLDLDNMRLQFGAAGLEDGARRAGIRARANLENTILNSESIVSGDASLLESSLSDVRNSIGAASSGLSPEVVREMRKDASDSVRRAAINGAIERNDIFGAKELIKGMEGVLPASELKDFRDSLKNRILNVDRIKEEQAILNVMSGEDGLFQESLDRDLTIAELEASYKTHNTPKTVQSVLNRMNGYGVSSEIKLSPEEKVANEVALFNEIAEFTSFESVTAADIETLRSRIYENLNNKSISAAKGSQALGQLIEPTIKNMEESMKTFSRDTLVPFDEIGFKKVKHTFERKLKIESDDSILSKSKLKALNNLNQLRLYNSYNDALVSLMPKDVPIGAIGTLKSKERNEILKNAQTIALNNYAFKTTGYQATDKSTDRDAMNAIQTGQEDQSRAASQDLIDSTYKESVIKNDFKEMSDEDLLKLLEDE